ncbi:hypothetical protein BaRGS_00008742, partial [Batillaria attramentaria]
LLLDCIHVAYISCRVYDVTGVSQLIPYHLACSQDGQAIPAVLTFVLETT